MPSTNYTCKLNTDQISQLRQILEQNYWEFDQVPYSHWRARKEKTSATAYESGKLFIQGKGTSEFVELIIEPQILKEVRFGYELDWAKKENPAMFEPHAGIDESGKGDYFGPLVIAAVFVDPDTAEKLFDLGVKDSKVIGSQKLIKNMASQIKTVVKSKFSLVSIGPESYNKMYTSLENVNRILAWGHARSLENLLEKQPHCTRAISDQFGRKSSVLNALMEKGKKIKLEQMPKAESDIAVAAASILARNEFVLRLAKLEEEANQELPKGASNKVIESAVSLVKTGGEKVLSKYAKIHFRTTEKVMEIVNTKKAEK